MKERVMFKDGVWQDKIDVQNFIQTNYTEYLGDSKFLTGPTKRTKKLWKNFFLVL